MGAERQRWGEFGFYPQMGGFAVGVGAEAAQLPSVSPPLKVTDFLQNREAAGRTLAAVWAVGNGAALDLGQGDLQAGQRVIAVRVSVAPLGGWMRR